MNDLNPFYIYPGYNDFSNDYWVSVNQLNLQRNMDLVWEQHMLMEL